MDSIVEYDSIVNKYFLPMIKQRNKFWSEYTREEKSELIMKYIDY